MGKLTRICAPIAVLLAPSMRNEDATSDYCQRWIQGVYILIIVGVDITEWGCNFNLYLTECEYSYMQKFDIQTG